MKRLLFFVCFLLAMGFNNSLFSDAYATNLKGIQQKSPSQSSRNTDYLQIIETGRFASPLLHQSIAQDGSSGLAYQKRQVIQAKDDKNVLDDNQQETRRLKAVEREYSFSGSTFGAETRNQIKVPANASFKMPTMQEAEKEVIKENIRFEECQEGDKNCAEYKVDSMGKVIW